MSFHDTAIGLIQAPLMGKGDGLRCLKENVECALITLRDQQTIPPMLFPLRRSKPKLQEYSPFAERWQLRFS